MSDTFAEHSEAIAAEFLHTVVAVDDQASFEDVADAPAGKVITPGRRAARRTGKDETVGVEQPTSLNARNVINSFAGQGMVCSVLKPKEAEWSDFLRNTGKAAERADAVVLDWQLFEAKDGARAIELLQGIRATDNEHFGRRSRLFLIYAGTPDPEAIAEALDEKCPGLEREGDSSLRLTGGSCTVAVYVKDHVEHLPEKWHEWRISEAELPERIVAEFARSRGGLLANTALKALAVLRQYSHDLLSRFPPELDAPYLTHRMLLSEPDAAVDLAVDLVGDEIAALLSENEVGDMCNLPAVRSRIEWQLPEGVKARLSPASGKTVECDSEQLCKLAQIGLEHSDAPGVLDVSKNAHKKAAAFYLLRWHGNSEAYDKRFALQTICRNTYTRRLPRLTLGTVLSQSAGANGDRYFVCLQPECDGVRLSEARGFPLFPAEPVEDGKPFDLIVRDAGGQLLNCRLRLNPYQCLVRRFAPDEGVGHVRAKRDGEVFVFEAVDEATPFVWCGQLKPAFAQKLATDFAAKACRVGVDPSEWLRRQAPG